MSNAKGYSEDDKWLVDMLKIAAEKDGEGSSDQLLIECIGRYEESQTGKTGFDQQTTNSYHASWIRDNWPKIYVKVDWEIRPNASGDKSIIDFQIYVSPKDQWENWECEFYLDEFDALNFHINQYIDNNTDGGEPTYDVKLDDHHLITSTGQFAEGEVSDKIETIIRDNEPIGQTGWSDLWAELDNGTYLGSYDIDFYMGDLDWETIRQDASGEEYEVDFKVIIKGHKSDDEQVYSRVFTAWQPNDIKLTINKEITNQSNYSSNFFDLPEYQLDGTTFRLYEDQNSTTPITNSDGEEAVWTIQNKNGGLSNMVKLPSEWAERTVYLEETLPSKATGFKKPARIAVTLPEAGESITASIPNEPLADPVMLVIKKISNTTDDGKPIADIDYNDIKYTLSYFGESPSAKSNAYANTGTKNTWVFATKEQGEYGRIDFTDEAYKISGDTLYKVNGEVRYPVGWYRIQENPDQTEFLHNKGLELSNAIYYVHIFINDANENDFEIFKGNEVYNNPIQGSNPNIAETREGEIYEKEHWEPFAFVKKDIHLSSGKPEGDTKLEGAVFTVYSEDANRFGTSTEYDGHTYSIGSGNVVLVDGNKLTITIDPDGRGICKYPLPKTDNTIGKRFYITETTAPLGYKANDVKYYVDFQKIITVKDYNDNTISLSIKNIETGTTSNETEIYSITYGSNNLNVNEVSVPYVNGSAYNTPRKGIIEIEKFDDDYGAVRNKYFFVQFAEKI